ncbi:MULTISPECIES: hypothetical protein [Hymenobacter]|uniref:DUF4476 domain-containing protein n=1 Tax=Hymenobacter armeniacus TaxID=2771358 RepID=A0ABR8JY02_9BACT|nr:MULTISPECIES: hypothetical protein [Hymenobacter]MBD2723452.1 hypothetical protein [Hymenobacter armeniacus]MBJ6107461.1 hypothetical protein [Hymenobacter sp. BT523]
MAQCEARNETAAPGLAPQARETSRITAFLADTLALSPTQRHALALCTQTQREALLLALTCDDVARTRQEYHQALRLLLDAQQLQAYVALCQQLAGTPLALDGTELARR